MYSDIAWPKESKLVRVRLHYSRANTNRFTEIATGLIIDSDSTTSSNHWDRYFKDSPVQFKLRDVDHGHHD